MRVEKKTYTSTQHQELWIACIFTSKKQQVGDYISTVTQLLASYVAITNDCFLANSNQ